MAARTARPTRGEWGAMGGMSAFVVLLHVLGWGGLLWLVVPHHYQLGTTGVYGVGLGITAYTLGMRHAFDADHIAAIDNTTRKLLTDGGKRPLSVGFWFSLGHSSVVMGLCLLLGFGVRSLAGQVTDDSSSLQHITGITGTAVSGTFLYLIGILNLMALVGILRVFRDMRRGVFDEETLEKRLAERGFMNRFLAGVTKSVRKPWQMYPIGFLFGLGFDTATEVGLLVLAGGAAAFHLPWYAVLVLPILFAAGMSLLDSIDGCFMNYAYGWAFARPVRKVYYNLTMTGLSVAVALVIGTIELLSILTDKVDVNLNYVGYGIVALFVATWVLSWAVWRFGRIEERWTARLEPARPLT